MKFKENADSRKKIISSLYSIEKKLANIDYEIAEEYLEWKLNLEIENILKWLKYK